jgi:K+-sensing histidine kinase KdpD
MKQPTHPQLPAILARWKKLAHGLNIEQTRRFLGSMALVLLVTLLGLPLNVFVHSANLVMLYLAAVVVAALYLGRSAAILTPILVCWPSTTYLWSAFHPPTLQTLNTWSPFLGCWWLGW